MSEDFVLETPSRLTSTWLDLATRLNEYIDETTIFDEANCKDFFREQFLMKLETSTEEYMSDFELSKLIKFLDHLMQSHVRKPANVDIETYCSFIVDIIVACSNVVTEYHEHQKDEENVRGSADS